MSGVEASVHVWVCHATEELRVILTKGFSIKCRVLFERWGVGFENMLLGPFGLVFFLYCDEGIPFFSLCFEFLVS